MNNTPRMALNNWSGGQLLAFSGIDGPSDYADGLCLRTRFDAVGFDVKLPGEARISLHQTPSAESLLAGDWFVLSHDTCGAFLDAYHVLIDGSCECECRSDRVTQISAGSRTLVGAAGHFDPDLLNADLTRALAARQRWLDTQRVPSGLGELRTRCLYKALSQMKTMVYSAEPPLGRLWSTPDRWPHRAMWLWDSAFHAIGFRHVDVALARTILRAVFDGQRSDGYVPHRVGPDGCSENTTQPPVLALAAELLEQTAPDSTFLEEMYPLLGAYVRWDMAYRDTDGAGLVEWRIEGDPRCRSGESGMDNSPRFDEATQLDATDFNAFLAHECELLASFAERLGRPGDAEQWRAQHLRLCGLINQRLWNDSLGFYTDYDVNRGRQSPVLASSGFLPLLCGAPSRDQAQKLVRALHDPGLFGTALPIPSIAVRDTEHYAKDMWRGPVWVNINWLIACGLRRYGFAEEASRLLDRTCARIERSFSTHGTFFEFFDDRCEVDPPRLLRKGRCAPEISPFNQVLHDYGWTATLYVDMLWEQQSAQPDRGCCR